jgi:1,4-alpha-glucan branching enzyme
MEYPVAYPPLASDLAPHPSNCNSTQLKVCYSGLLMQSKGVHILLEAIARLKQIGHNIKLSIAGKAFSPIYEDELKNYAARVEISNQITWCGFMEGNQLQNFYQEQEVLVFPSLHPESFGMVVAEAMATGVVPISSGVGGAIEVITHGRNGLLVQPENSEALANQLAWCISNKTVLKSMAKKAIKDSVKLYSPTRSATELHKCFKKISRGLYA